MNKIAISISLFLVPVTICLAGTPSIENLRILYSQAATEERVCQEMLSILMPFNSDNDPLRSGYKACAMMMMAKYTLNPFKKLSYFSKGKKILESAVNADENNVELRFLRFIIQNAAPSFLGYRGEVILDKVFILKSVGQIKDLAKKKWIITVLQRSSFITEAEKGVLS